MTVMSMGDAATRNKLQYDRPPVAYLEMKHGQRMTEIEAPDLLGAAVMTARWLRAGRDEGGNI
jgi:hypothetical protein